MRVISLSIISLYMYKDNKGLFCSILIGGGDALTELFLSQVDEMP